MPENELGKALTIWTARTAAVLYFTALLMLLCKRWRPSRIAATAGLIVYLVHVWCAFEYFYEWSHAVAYRETARQTAKLFHVNWGGGLYLNYLFTVLWFGDVAALWLASDWPARRARLAVHAFLAFMVVNATLVVWILQA